MSAGRVRVATRRACRLLAFVLALAPAAGARTLRLEALGAEPVLVPGVGDAELSGLTWTGGTRYLAVDDGGARLCSLDVSLDAAESAIAAVSAGPFVALAGARDVEGIAWRASTGTVLVADEGWEEIREYDPATGERKKSFPAPPAFRGRLRKDRGYEGITFAPGGRSVWLANEGPLGGDGAQPDEKTGALVRLQRLDAALVPDGQWAYRTEPGRGFVGVVDLLVAPTGELLVLERSLTGAGFAAHVFQIDFAGATETSALPSLAVHHALRPVRKLPLFERSGGFQNFEGMALGPELARGGRLVLLVSDGGGRRPPYLLALRLVTESVGR